MRKTNKEQVYLVNQPKHITTTIIVVGDEFPLSEGAHNDIENLCGISDVLFMFAPKYFTHQNEINFDKFARLYRCCAWIESGASLGSTLIKLFEYDKEIFNCHRDTIIVNSWDLGEIDTSKLISIISSPLTKPILKIERLSNEEFYDIYKDDDYTLDHPMLRYLAPKKEALEKAFCSYKSTSELAFFRNNVIDTICNFYNNEEDTFPKEYINSFTDSDIKYLLGSIIKYLGIDHFNANYKNIKL